MKKPGQVVVPDVTQLATCKPPGNGSELAVSAEPPLLHEDQKSSPSEWPGRKAGSISLARRGTGPQTPAGKRLSSRNAVKHGIFSRELVLKGESRVEFNSLHAALRENFRPVGQMEELLVEKLAVLQWRYRRLLLAERTEFENARCPQTSGGADYETRLRQIREAQALVTASPAPGGLLGHLSNPLCVREAKQLLTQLCEKIANRGPDWNKDSQLLREIYGFNPLEKPPNLLFQLYAALAKPGNHPEQAVGITFGAGEEGEVVANLLKVELQNLERLIQALKQLRNPLKNGSKRMPLRLPAEWLDRFLRPEAYLSREFDRTLSQLERLQRMRLGQPVPPEINVNIST